MDLTAFAEALYQSSFSGWMRGSLKALPMIEAIHVMAVAVVYGTIVVIDLRLIGLMDVHRPFTRVFREVLRWTWVGFAFAVVTGVLLFVPNARSYVVNTAFGLKLVALACAGLNMAVFEFTTLRSVAAWDTATMTPRNARLAGMTSLVLWTAVIVCGRWIGFTKGYDFTVPAELDFSFP